MSTFIQGLLTSVYSPCCSDRTIRSECHQCSPRPKFASIICKGAIWTDTHSSKYDKHLLNGNISSAWLLLLNRAFIASHCGLMFSVGYKVSCWINSGSHIFVGEEGYKNTSPVFFHSKLFSLKVQTQSCGSGRSVSMLNEFLRLGWMKRDAAVVSGSRSPTFL